jgi:hypothetical protein
VPSVSRVQHNLMAMVANNPKVAKRVGISKSTGAEFMKADKGKKFGKGGLDSIFKGKESYSEELKEGKAIKSGKISPQQYAKGERMEDKKKMKAGGKMMAKGGKVDNTLSDRDPETGLHRNAYAFEGGDIKNKAWTKSGTSMSKKDVDSASDKELKSAARTNVDPRIKRGDVKDLENLYEAKRKSSGYNKSRDIVDKINPEGGSSRGTDYGDGMKRGGKVKSCGMAKGGAVKADGKAIRGKTKGRFV